MPVSYIELDNGCWQWMSGFRLGYGRIGDEYAHRIMYENLIGKIKNNLVIDHLCRNRACVNPDHLEPVTIKENVLRGQGLMARNARKEECTNNHKFTLTNTYRRKDRKTRECKLCRSISARKYLIKKEG